MGVPGVGYPDGMDWSDSTTWIVLGLLGNAAFFSRFFVANYCPLAFVTASGANLTPDRLPASERAPLFAACDRALRRLVDHLEPRIVIGLGAFAEARAREALAGRPVRIGGVLHPSPASPAANRGWAEQAERQLRELGIDVPGASVGV